MEKLNSYLQQMLNTAGYELHLEPNKNPYILTSEGQVDAASTPLPGTQINSMIFSLIPDAVKQQLPNQPEVEFVHPHNLGSFNFLVKKSPSGFNVTISPAVGESPDAEANESESTEDSPSPVEVQNFVPEAPVEAAQPVEPIVEAQVQEEVKVEPDVAPVEATPEQESPDAGQDADSPDTYEIDASVADAGFEYEFVSVEENAQEADAEATPETETVENEVASQASDAQQASESAEPEQAASNVETEVPANQQSEPVVEADSAARDAAEETSQEEQIPATQEAAPEPTYVQHDSFTPANPAAQADMDALFRQMAEVGASDLHLSVSMPPLVRKDGKMCELSPGSPQLTPDSIKNLLTSIMPSKNLTEFEERNDTDFAYEIAGLARFRANVFRDRKGMGGVFRIIPSDIMTAEDLNLSPAIMNLCELSKGLVVVTGPTGSGKSTTLCAMVDWINKNREDHIITIEDPIEFTHENIKCLVNQREVHNHTTSFKHALRAALREDPDILLVGEMRDLETISIAIETAETGHLVFGTLHTTTAASTVDRIIDQFPADRQQQIRVMLSESLKGVIAQTLLPKKGGGRIAALEVLIVTPAIANLIREGKTFQIPSQMQTGKNLGMTMLNDSLMELVNNDLVEPKDAYIKAVDKDGFETLLSRSGKKI